jgi:hypothetical protein
MYKELYDENHKYFVWNPQSEIVNNREVKKPSSGIYENDLLCKQCDNDILGLKYEDYASKLLNGGKFKPTDSPRFGKYYNEDGTYYTKGDNVNYCKMKLFLLSILWRASISSQKLFEDVQLGDHEEIIRKMIYNNDPGQISDYPIFISTYLNDLDIPSDLISHPKKVIATTGHITFVFLITGFIFQFFISDEKLTLPKFALASTIKPSNEIVFSHLPIGKGWELISKYYNLNK